ncbi:MAG TPA: ATP-binding protein [Gemmataceae bacterium]|nr:ATP-binding protein [Gemmataceae bacterium]
MMSISTPKTYEQLLEENEHLRQRLEEPEATIEAIRHGEVDAVVVYGPFGEEIYTLEGADRPYRQLVEAMQQGAATVDAQGAIVYCNRYFAEMLGKPKDELIGTPVQGLVVETEQPIVAEMLQNAHLQKSIRNEVRLRRGADGAFPAELILHTLPFRGKLCLIASDLTRQKQYEELLEARRELAEAGRRKDEFLALLGHELRNPLAPIRHALQVVHMRGAERRKDVQKAWEIIDRQMTQLVRLVDDMLDVNRIARGKITLLKEAVDVAKVIALALESSRSFIEERGHALEVALPPEPLMVEVDPTRMSQVFLNLLNNAAKYTPTGGRIRVVAEKRDDQVVVRVHDTGVGIPAETLPRIFDLFIQEERTRARAEGGLGIGLTLVRRLTEMHNGTVEACSAGPGQGSEFVVRLPLLADPGCILPERQDTDGRHRIEPETSRRILIVEDNKDSAESLAMLLRLAEHNVQTVHDGRLAHQAAMVFKPDVILLDIGLPGISGYEVVRQLRSEPALATTVIVALTGYGTEDDHRHSKAEGFAHHLVKPVKFDTLLGLLADVERSTH